MKKIEIDPTTRLEGHAKIAIFLDEEGEVKNTYFQVPELRGFEQFCRGRNVEEMPRITTSICGVCPVAHHMASTKALDDLYRVEVPPTGHKLRNLMYCAYMYSDHLLHFYYLGGPDFILGPDVGLERRNILGVIEEVGLDLGKEVIAHRSMAQEIVGCIGGDAIQPVSCTAGGLTSGLAEEKRVEIKRKAQKCLNFAQKTLEVFSEIVLEEKEYLSLIKSDGWSLPTHYMGLVGEDNELRFYDGEVRVVSSKGKEISRFDALDYLDYIEEKVEGPWTYLKFPYLKRKGWNGVVAGEDSGIFRVGSLARINVADTLSTPLAQKEFERFFEVLGPSPVHNTLAYHWARLIETLYSAERMVELAGDKTITSDDFRIIPHEIPHEGVGVCEAARGTLFHHYRTNEKGVIKNLNLIVPTTHNHGGISLSIKKAAQKVISESNSKTPEDLTAGELNRVEMALRAHDPCIACATHSIPGNMPLELIFYDEGGNRLGSIDKDRSR